MLFLQGHEQIGFARLAIRFIHIALRTCIYGCREAVDEGVTGLLCTVKDADSLYEQMKKMALMPREERAQMGLDGRKKMERQFDKRIVVQNTVNAIFPDRTVCHTGR